MSADLLVTHDGPIATVTLNRPDARNAYSEEMAADLVRAICQCDADPEVRVVILTGAGDAFSAGGDLKAMREQTGMFAGSGAELRDRYHHGLQQVARAFETCEKPVVAAINGAAIGAGLDLACMCDIRIASDRARFGETFVSVGLVPGDGGAYFLSRVIGFSRALEMALTARLIDAAEALRIGLVSGVVPAEALMGAAQAAAMSIARQAPIAVKLTKAAFYRGYQKDLETALTMAAAFQGLAQRTSDHQEGVAAILEGRKPNFRGQ
ncbi:MAG: enoyl-CoA hydratase/isomerase family protein [Candidatus Sericytochromatia bacterium]|nr:enoyl-CoA hydratase/isomerase family protein [Candidatus Sericytochromatia bacterium]